MKSIVISCNYNEEKTGNLEDCLKHLQETKLNNTIIGMIDNNSKDNSVSLIKKYKDNKTIDLAFQLPQNIGKARALNILFKQLLLHYDISSQDLVIHLDSDISLPKEYIKDSEHVFNTFNDCILYLTLSSKDKNTFIYNNGHQFDLNLFKMTDKPPYKSMPICTGINGGILSMKCSVFHFVNYYNEYFRIDGKPTIYGGDDAYLILQLSRYFKNYKVYINSNLFHYHPEPIDIEYWKIDQVKKLQIQGINGTTQLDNKGYYD